MRKEAKPLPFTEEQMKQVFSTNMIDFAISNGFQVEKGDRHSVHVKNSGGLYFFNHGRGYYCFGTEKKGNIIDFVKDYYGLDFIPAVEMILGAKAYDQTRHYITPTEKAPKQELVLPPKDENYNRVIAYLVYTRGIAKEIVYQMIKEKRVYQSKTEFKGKSFGNCAFVGFDEQKEPKYCSIRSMSSKSSFRQDVSGSDKTYGFTMEGKSNRVYEFEAPIDAMSHATLSAMHGLDWTEDHRVSEGGLSDKTLERYLSLHKEITEIVFCYDNDIEGKLPDGTPHNHGQIKAAEMAQKYGNLGYEVMIQTPNNKDFNADLQQFRQMIQANSVAKESEVQER